MEEKVLEVFKYVFEDDSINTSISQENYPNWDSLKQLNLMIELEAEFGISIEPEDQSKMKTFEDVVKVVKSKL
jgi:acyl carrier protein